MSSPSSIPLTVPPQNPVTRDVLIGALVVLTLVVFIGLLFLILDWVKGRRAIRELAEKKRSTSKR